MKFIDFFAGIGGFRRGMELAGHECVGFCEFDKFAIASYVSMHLLTDEQREHLAELPLTKRQKEILKEQYKNGEFFANDITGVDARSLPAADIWCFGFPCQDISAIGRRSGVIQGNRSGLFYEITRLLRQSEPQNRPEFLFAENVKNLLSINRGWDFAAVLNELDEVGYDAEWSVLNTKNFGIPQNRERLFVVGHNRTFTRKEILFNQQGHEQRYQSDAIEKTVHETALCLTAKGQSNWTGSFIVQKAPEGEHHDNMALFRCGRGIRALTPKECFRLQGWSDDYFYKAQFINSDTQLYKQAGNGVTVNVIKAIGERFKLYEPD